MAGNAQSRHHKRDGGQSDEGLGWVHRIALHTVAAPFAVQSVFDCGAAVQFAFPMSDLQEIICKLKPFLAPNAGNARGLKFDLKGDGFIHVLGAEVTDRDAPADCTIIVSLADLERISKGDLDPAEAFQQGRLRIDGDIGVAMALQPFFSQAWA